MKITLMFGLCYFGLVQIIDTKYYRAIPLDEIFTYERLDRNVPPYTEMFSIDNLLFEQIDDDNVFMGGYLLWLKSMNHHLPIQMNLRTQYLEQGTWREGPLKLIIPDMCQEYVNPARFWYNISKLFTKDICPPLKGDKWIVEPQNLSVIFNFPPTFAMGPWRGYFLVTQGLPGFETCKFGMGFQTDLFPV